MIGIALVVVVVSLSALLLPYCDLTSINPQSNNMVFDTVARHYQDLHASDPEPRSLPHFIISNLEHDSVDLTARKMEELERIGMWPNTSTVDVHSIM